MKGFAWLSRHPETLRAAVSGTSQKGFTLIELLVVVLIIGILSSVALPQYTKAVEKARATQAITLVKSLADAEKVYYMSNGAYTDDLSALDISLPGNPSGSNAIVGDFTISLHEMNSSIAHIQALYTRYSYADSWYILFYLQRDKLDCVAHKNSVSGNNLCKSFNSQPEQCLENNFLCYPL